MKKYKSMFLAVLAFISAAIIGLAPANAQYLPLSGGTMTGTLIAPYPDVLSSAYANIGGISGPSLASSYGLNNSGRMLLGWNLTSGGGETDFIINRGAGGVGGLNIYDISNTSSVITKVFGVDGAGNLSVTGNMNINGNPNFYFATTGGQPLFASAGTNVLGIVGAAITNSTSGTDSQGGTFIGYGSSNNSGNATVAVGIEGEAVGLTNYGGYILNQVDATNATGVAPPENNPYTGFGGRSSTALNVSTGAVNQNNFSTYGLSASTPGNISALLALGGCSGTSTFACYSGSSDTAQGLRGILFNAVALVGSCGTPAAVHCGTSVGGIAVDMANSQELRWMGSTTTTYAELWGSSQGIVIATSGAQCAHFARTSSETVTCTSDRRLKHDISDADSVLPYLKEFHIRSYKENETNYFVNAGVIAQEVQENHPELVHLQNDNRLAVDQVSNWLLVKAIQELSERLEAQQRENADLRKEVNRIRASTVTASIQ